MVMQNMCLNYKQQVKSQYASNMHANKQQLIVIS